MKQKQTLVLGIVAGLVILGGGAYAYNDNQNKKEYREALSAANAQTAKELGSMAGHNMSGMSAEEMRAMGGDEAMKGAHGAYVKLEDYRANSAKYADTKRVYFFHASWCPICRGIEEEVKADVTRIPEGVTLIEVDFDSATELRKQYGVTYQYTFVQLDNADAEVAQWSATNLTGVLGGIRS